MEPQNFDPLNNQPVSKVDAASRQFSYAVSKLFSEEEPLAVYTVVCAAAGIYRDLCGVRNRFPIAESIAHKHSLHLPAVLRRLYIYRNFLKHANQDPQGSIVFDVDDLDMALAVTASDALTLCGAQNPPEVLVYLRWFLATQSVSIEKRVWQKDVLTYLVLRTITAELDRLNPGLRNSNRSTKLEHGRVLLSEINGQAFVVSRQYDLSSARNAL